MTSILSLAAHSLNKAVQPCRILTCNKGTFIRQDLEKLFHREIDCLIVDGFLQKESLEQEQSLMAGYHKGLLNFSANYAYWGFSCEEALRNNTVNYYYHKSASQSLKKLREDASPYMPWIDKFRLDLDAEFPFGAHIEANHLEKRQAFIVRHRDKSMKSLIENRMIPDSFRPQAMKAHFIAMQCLVAAEKGGHLDLYPGFLNTREHLELSQKRLEIYPPYLPASTGLVRPYEGRLIIFNGQIPFKFSSIEPRVIQKQSSKKEESKKEEPLILYKDQVMMESYIIYNGDNKALTIMR